MIYELMKPKLPPVGTILAKRVVTYAKGEIMANRLRPNQKISEGELSRWLRISRTPVREALRMLQTEGLVVIVAQKGAFVVDVTPEESCGFFPSVLLGRFSSPVSNSIDH